MLPYLLILVFHVQSEGGNELPELNWLDDSLLLREEAEERNPWSKKRAVMTFNIVKKIVAFLKDNLTLHDCCISISFCFTFSKYQLVSQFRTPPMVLKGFLQCLCWDSQKPKSTAWCPTYFELSSAMYSNREWPPFSSRWTLVWAVIGTFNDKNKASVSVFRGN